MVSDKIMNLPKFIKRIAPKVVYLEATHAREKYISDYISYHADKVINRQAKLNHKNLRKSAVEPKAVNKPEINGQKPKIVVGKGVLKKFTPYNPNEDSGIRQQSMTKQEAYHHQYYLKHRDRYLKYSHEYHERQHEIK